MDLHNLLISDTRFSSSLAIQDQLLLGIVSPGIAMGHVRNEMVSTFPNVGEEEVPMELGFQLDLKNARAVRGGEGIVAMA